MREQLTEANIIFVKCPASCTDTIGNACDRSNLFKSSKRVLKTAQSSSSREYKNPGLERLISETLRQYHPGITDHKRRIYSEGLVRIARSLAHVVTFDIVANQFKRIGLDPVDSQLCFVNCRQDVLESIGKTKLDDVALKIPDMA